MANQGPARLSYENTSTWLSNEQQNKQTVHE